MCIHIGRHKVSGLKYEPAQAFTFACIDLAELTNYRHLRVRFKIIDNVETMHESDLPTFLIIISSPIIFKRSCTSTRIAARAARLSRGAQAALPTLGGPSRSQDPSLQNQLIYIQGGGLCCHRLPQAATGRHRMPDAESPNP